MGMLAIDRQHCRASTVNELIHRVAHTPRERANHDLRIDACADDDLRSAAEQGPEKLHGALMLSVARVQERDHDVGIERYSRHSLRSSSR